MWGERPFGRVLSTPRKRAKHVLLDVLAPDGTMGAYTVSRKKVGREDYRYVRKVRAGSTVPMVLLGEPAARRSAADAEVEEEYYEEAYEDEELALRAGGGRSVGRVRWGKSE
jgi:hypothetical protein